MTVLRGLATRIADRTVRWASPSAKEWAKATAREVEFIPSDWRALAWAIGSTRVLLDRRAPAATGSQPGPKRPSVYDWFAWLMYLDADAWVCGKLTSSAGWEQRLGWSLVLLCSSYWSACSVFDWLRERWKPSPSDIRAYRQFLRQRLELKLTRYRTVRRWFPLLASLAGWSGYLLVVRGQVHLWGWVAFCLWAAAHPVGDTPAKIRARIERLDLLIAQPDQTGVRRVHSEHWGMPARPH